MEGVLLLCLEGLLVDLVWPPKGLLRLLRRAVWICREDGGAGVDEAGGGRDELLAMWESPLPREQRAVCFVRCMVGSGDGGDGLEETAWESALLAEVPPRRAVCFFAGAGSAAGGLGAALGLGVAIVLAFLVAVALLGPAWALSSVALRLVPFLVVVVVWFFKACLASRSRVVHSFFKSASNLRTVFGTVNFPPLRASYSLILAVPLFLDGGRT